MFLSLVAACFVISLTPGAGAINTMTNSLNEGWRRSVWGIFGQQIALIVHVVIVAAGVGLIVAQSPLLFNSIRYIGAAYLVYLGVRLMLIKTDANVDPAEGGEDHHRTYREGAWSMVRRGFWVNLTNPKAIVFFLAFMPQFIRLNLPALPQYLIFTITVLVVDVIVMWFVFALSAKPFRKLTSTPRGRRTLNTVFGSLFIVVAGLLLFIH